MGFLEIMTEIERIESILKNSRAIVFYWKATAGWPVEYVSENVSLLGYQAKELMSGQVSYPDMIHPHDIKRVSEEVSAYTKMRRSEFRQVYRLLHKDGSVRWVDDRTAIEWGETGEPEFYIGTLIDITEQKQVEEKSCLLSNVVNNSSEEVYIFEQGSFKFTYINRAASESLGVSPEEIVGLTPFDIKKDLESGVFGKELAPLMETYDPTQVVRFETTMQRRDGSNYPVQAKIQAMEVDGRLQFVAVLRDISEHVALIAEKERQNSFVEEVIDGVADQVVVVNPDYSLGLMNRAAKLALKTHSFEDKNNPKCYELLFNQQQPCQGSFQPCPLEEVLERKKPVSVMQYRENDGEHSYVKVLTKPFKDSMGKVIGMVESVHDVTDLMLAQEQLKKQADEFSFQATHDSLTGLPNRRLFQDRLEESLKRAQRLSSLVAVVFVDVDKFKVINDSVGHQAGDEVLVAVAKRLQGIIRSCDTVARMGGDEFTLILEAFKTIDDIEHILSKLQQQFIEPIQTHKGNVQVTLSIGASCYPDDGSNHKVLLHNADIALYDVKMNGRNAVRCFHKLESPH